MTSDILAAMLGELTAAYAALYGGATPVDLEDRLAGLCAAARRDHPTLELADVDLVVAIARGTHGDAARVERCMAADLALATAAAAGSREAIATIARTYAPAIDGACHRFAGEGYTVDDLRQILHTKLFVTAPPDPPRIASYDGLGSLANWIRITAIRLFIDVTRRKDRQREVLSDETPVLAAATDLALQLIKAEYRGVVATALGDAVAALAQRDRYLLREHLVHRMSIDELGAALGIHRATAARRVAAARAELAATTRRLVAERLSLADAELGDVYALVASGLDVSIGGLLGRSIPPR